MKRKFDSIRGDRSLFPVVWKTDFTITLLLCAISVVVCCLVFYGSNSIRGTDQFWYLADVEAAIDGEPPVTNAFFPGSILRGDVGPDKPNYIFHNGPMISISAFLGKYTGAYRAWILINVFCHFAVALAVFLGARALTTTAIAAVVSALYLLSPLALWQTMSMLLEQYLAGVMSVVVVGYFYRQTLVGKLLFSSGIILGALSHPIFVAVGLVAGIALIARGHSTRCRPMMLTGVLTMLCVIYLRHNASVIYPTGFFPNLSILIANVVPNMESMYWYFTDQGYTINVAILFSKITEALARQFTHPLQMPFNIFTNLALITWIWLFLVRRDQYIELLVASGTVLALYFGLIVLMQHQVRYQQLISPVVFILIAVFVHKFPFLRNRTFVACLFVCVLLTGGYLSHLSHKRADFQGAILAEQARNLDFMPPDSRIVAFDCKCDQRLNYLLKPRPILNIKSRYLNKAAQLKVLSMFAPDYFVSSDAFLDRDFAYLSPVKSARDSLHGTLYWFRVDTKQLHLDIRLSELGAH